MHVYESLNQESRIVILRSILRNSSKKIKDLFLFFPHREEMREKKLIVASIKVNHVDIEA